MNSLWRLLMNVPVLLLLAARPVFAADAPALPPGVTPQQAEAAKQMIQSGAPLPPEAQKALQA
ncbi:MAG: hypothetical protein HZB86_10440, partial [Deltaproteobacteria bacterium]|nr:hypothetical protein [Deltaproteobacteria bacterium]